MVMLWRRGEITKTHPLTLVPQTPIILFVKNDKLENERWHHQRH